MPELHVLAGPNGSGKSSFTQQVRIGTRTIDYTIPPVINPDVIASRMNPNDPDAAALAAGREAVTARSAAIARGESFAIETTLSGHAEIRTIHDAIDAGYLVTMTYIAMKSAELSLLRVLERAVEETRTVPHDVVLRRYPRSLANLTAVLPQLDRVDVYDNSASEIRSVARLDRGRMISVSSDMPAWAAQALREPLRTARDRATVARDAIAQLESELTSFTQSVVEEDVSRNAVVAGTIRVKSDQHVAVATSPWSFAVCELQILDREPELLDDVRVEVTNGRGHVHDANDQKRDRSRKRGR